MSQDFDRRQFICSGCALATVAACGGNTAPGTVPTDGDTGTFTFDTDAGITDPSQFPVCEVELPDDPEAEGWRAYDMATFAPELLEVGGWSGRPHPDDGRLLIMAHVQEGCYAVMERACTHQGVLIEYDAGRGQFMCPRHASLYNWEGHVVGGPAPNALETFPAAAIGTILYVWYG